VVEITPIFATPFAVVPLAAAAALNPALATLLRGRAAEEHRDPALPSDPRCFRGREDLFEWDEPTVALLRQAILGGACAAVMAANLYPEAEFDGLGVQARARLVIVRPDGCLPAASMAMASWYAVYCVAAPLRPSPREDSGSLRLYAVRQAMMFKDAANWRLRPPFGTGHHRWRPVAGQMAVFPASIAHEVALNRTEEDLVLVTARLRFAHAGQTAGPPW
jgi:hypothetical protein